MVSILFQSALLTLQSCTEANGQSTHITSATLCVGLRMAVLSVNRLARNRTLSASCVLHNAHETAF